MTRSIGMVVARSSRLLLVGALILITAFSLGPRSNPAAHAQDATAAHPLVGVWLLDTDADDPANSPSLAVFSADGANWQADADGSNGYGAWEATGETTANLTVVFHEEDDKGNFMGTFKVRASIEVAADGQSLTGSYTGELIQPDGTSMGQIGPGTVTAERIVVEAPGTPVASFEEAFGAPEATPAP